METKVEKLMTKSIGTCTPDDSMGRAAEIMEECDCGCLPVVESNDRGVNLVGMITDRDICLAGAKAKKPLHEIPVQTAMSTQVHTCTPDQTASEAEKIMSDNRIRRLAVVDKTGRTVGMLSLADLARATTGEQKKARATKEGQRELAQTLSTISRPAGQSQATH